MPDTFSARVYLDRDQKLLDVAAIHKTYPAVRGPMRAVLRSASEQPVEALRGVSLSVAPGEIVGLVGPNGAGKTTLFRIVATLLDPTAGHVSVGGYNLERDPVEIRKRIGLVLQGDQGLYRRLTGRENLRFFGVMQGFSTGEATQRAEFLMDRLGLAARDRRVFGYSAGMRVRLALARALLTDPPLLLLDEPTRSLDPAASADFVKLAGEFAESGTAILMSTHRLNEVVAACDRAVLITDGVVQFDGVPSEVVAADGVSWSRADDAE